MKPLRILIFRPDNIGDIVLFSGALQHIRHLYPQALITLAVKNSIINLVELCPYVDGCIPLEKLAWSTRIKKKAYIPGSRILKMIQKAQRWWYRFFPPFDLAIYPVKSPAQQHLDILYHLKIRKIFGIVGCKINQPPQGYRPESSPERLFTHRLDVSSQNPWRHELETNLDFLKFLGSSVSTVSDLQPEFWLAPADRDFADKLLGQPLSLALFPGASFEQKVWEIDNYRKLSKLIAPPVHYIILGGPTDKKLAAQVESILTNGDHQGTVMNLAGKTTLRELARCISACDLFLGMDTSGIHVAVALGIPSIAIVGGGHYGRFVPWGDPDKHIFLTKRLECFHCNWRCVRNCAECIQKVTPEEVAYWVSKLLQKKV